MFVRKKNISGRDYYYIVKSTRIDNTTWKKIERYVGLNAPTQKELQMYEKEFDTIKLFLQIKNNQLDSFKRAYQKKINDSTKDELHNFEQELLIKFTFDTNRIEGSPLSYKDTKFLLQDGITPKEKPLRDIKETENHKISYLFVKNNLQKNINREFILELHRLLKQNVTEDAGKFRDGQVKVGNLIPIKASMIETEITNLLEWYKNNKNLHPLELAATFHCIFERIHPFFDGNGRVGRLLLNFILLKKGFPLIIIQNKNKRRYYTALQRADDGNYLYMIKYLFSELEQQYEYLL
ncbi:Fic family protein [Candidatus Woesearchaeota archaeon]|nr:Fic family protein [Candidatus Woesearchaeota archaeon]